MNVLVVDTEMYSNTGGQCSKSTPAGSTAMFASGGKKQTKKNIGEICKYYCSFALHIMSSHNSMDIGM